VPCKVANGAENVVLQTLQFQQVFAANSQAGEAYDLMSVL
jgi:hypothetical protein